MKKHRREQQRAVDPALSWLRCMNTAATIDPFIAAMMSATVIATGTAR